MNDDKRRSNDGEKVIDVAVDESGSNVVTTDDGRTITVASPAAERALTRKFDLRILPVLAIMYLFTSLDKSNLGNAKTHGLEKTLK